MPEESEKTSLKAVIQQITGEGAQVLQGVVKSVSPLKIQMAGDDKLIIGPNITYLPKHLTDYTTEITVDWQTEHASGGTGTAEYASHSHAITGRKTITVHNALKVGDLVHVLSFCRGKQYYVLDRVS